MPRDLAWLVVPPAPTFGGCAGAHRLTDGDRGRRPLREGLERHEIDAIAESVERAAAELHAQPRLPDAARPAEGRDRQCRHRQIVRESAA